MFVGHYGVSLAAKAVDDRIPLWVLVGAAQVLDMVWCVLIVAGVETIAGDPSRTEGLDFTYYPYSHSFVAALFWSLLAMVAARRIWRAGLGRAAIVGAVVFSHWLLDLAVHHPDLAILPGRGPKLGLSLWDLGMGEYAIEVSLLTVAALALAWRERSAAAAGAFAAIGALMMVGSVVTKPGTAAVNPVQVGIVGLATYAAFTLIAYWLERRFGGSGNTARR